MASDTYGKDIMESVIMAKILWQMKLSLLFTYIQKSVCKLQVCQYIDLKYIVLLLTSHSIKILVFKTSQGLLNWFKSKIKFTFDECYVEY